MFPTIVLAAALTVPPCWNIFDTALQRSAMSAHPAFVSYDERILVTQDDQRLVQSVAHVDYRDDGLARVRDERFNFEPILTRHTEPGPPELGPYGSNRENWLPQSDFLPTIAAVRTQGDVTCTMADIEDYKGRETYHLTFSGANASRPSLRDLWIDTASNTIWKVVVTGFVHFDDDPDSPRALAEFQVELGYAGPYLVVNHVVWAYSRREYSQTSDYFGEYVLSGYRFPTSMPPGFFADAAARGSP